MRSIDQGSSTFTQPWISVLTVQSYSPSEMSRGKLTEADKLGIIEWYERGESTRKVGKRFGINKATVRRVLMRRGIQRRARNNPWKLLKSEQEEVWRRYLGGEGSTTIARDYPVSSTMIQNLMRRKGVLRSGSKIGNVEKKKIVERYESGERVRQIAEDMSVSRKTVERYIKEAGIPFRFGWLTEAQEQEIEDRYSKGESTYQISRELSESRWTVLEALRRRDIAVQSELDAEKDLGILSETDLEEAVRLYLNGWNTIDVATHFSVNKRAIWKLLRRQNIPRRILSEAQRKYRVVEDFFKDIDSEEKSYWLGFLMADGSISERNEINLKLSWKDRFHIEKYRKCLGSNHPIRSLTTFLPATGRHYRMATMTIISFEMVNDLKKWGIVPNKTLMESFPCIDGRFASHFIRGVFDGDGSIGKSHKRPHFNIAGNERFLLDLQRHLRLSGVSKTKLTPCGRIHYLTYGGIGNIRKIYQYLYSNATVWLDRKREKFEEILFGDKLVGESSSEGNGIVPLDRF